MSEEILPADKLTELKEEFANFDKEGTGLIKIDELIPFLRCIGLNPLKSECSEVLQRCASESNMVDFATIANLVQSLGWDRNAEQIALVNAFAEFDPENTGYIDATILKKKLSSIGEDQLTKEDIDILLSLQVKTDDGKINYKELSAAMCRKV